MNVSRTIAKPAHNNSICCAAAILCFTVVAGGAQASTVPSPVSTPIGAGVQSAGGVVSAAGAGHAGIAPTVYSTAPSLEPFADGVTNGLNSVGAGLKASGQNVQSGGLALNPVAGAKTGLQTVRGGSLAQVHAGSLGIGRGSPTTIIGVGALTSSPPQGTLATAGVANANALLNANVAPQ